MNRKLIALGTVAVLTAGMTGAAFAADRYASPSQPVPYSQLNAYMKGSTSKRAAILAQNTDATPAASAGVNSSATVPAAEPSPAAQPMPNNSATSNGQPNVPSNPTPNSGPSAVNPPADVATPPTSPSSPTPQ